MRVLTTITNTTTMVIPAWMLLLLVAAVASPLTAAYRGNRFFDARVRRQSVQPHVAKHGSLGARRSSAVWGNGASDDDNLVTDTVRWFRRGQNIDQIAVGKECMTKYSEIRTLPLFPFDDGQAFPTGSLPLNLFMMSFRMMLNDVQNTDRMFGIVMSDGRGGICEIGTAVENVRRELLPDGRQILDNVCRQRFRVLKIVQEEPYMIAEVEYGLIDNDVSEAETTGELPPPLAALEKEVYQCLSDVINLTNMIYMQQDTLSNMKQDTKPAVEISEAVKLLSPVSHPFRLTAASDFSFAICDMLFASHTLRQLWLQTTTVEGRLKGIRTALKSAREYLMEEVAKSEQPFN